MPSTREIRQRIRGVRNIQQITRAMDMIATARLRRLQQSVIEGRPVAARIAEILADVIPAAGEAAHPLLERRAVDRSGVVVISGERGLCGGYNANVMERALDVGARRLGEGAELRYYVVGRKGIDSARRRGLPMEASFAQPHMTLPLEEVLPIVQRLMSDYRTGSVDRIDLVYTAFESPGRYGPRDMELLPIEMPVRTASARPCRFEPDAGSLLDFLVLLYLKSTLQLALVESMASEQAARMVAMHSATESADKMIRQLTKSYNRARQTSITTEILEVVAGAEALLHGDEGE